MYFHGGREPDKDTSRVQSDAIAAKCYADINPAKQINKTSYYSTALCGRWKLTSLEIGLNLFNGSVHGVG